MELIFEENFIQTPKLSKSIQFGATVKIDYGTKIKILKACYVNQLNLYNIITTVFT